ncbi:RecX family transcriptional regulator [Pseudanabaena biceps]|nr:RecX family transcriptional regulator [Pseudanabaena biceps]
MDTEDSEKGGRRRQKPRRDYAPREPRSIDAAQLQEMALGYAARYATTAAKLRRYLQRKLGERIWTPADPPDIDGLVTRLTGLGYVNDRAYAASKQRDLTARGFGTGRVRSALAAAGVARADVAAVLLPEDGTIADPYAPAIAFARRRRFGPFARDGASHDPAKRNRELVAMARAGHDFAIAKRVLNAADAVAAEELSADD